MHLPGCAHVESDEVSVGQLECGSPGGEPRPALADEQQKHGRAGCVRGTLEVLRLAGEIGQQSAGAGARDRDAAAGSVGHQTQLCKPLQPGRTAVVEGHGFDAEPGGAHWCPFTRHRLRHGFGTHLDQSFPTLSLA